MALGEPVDPADKNAQRCAVPIDAPAGCAYVLACFVVFSGVVSFALYLLQPVVPGGDLFLVFEVSGGQQGGVQTPRMPGAWKKTTLPRNVSHVVSNQDASSILVLSRHVCAREVFNFLRRPVYTR